MSRIKSFFQAIYKFFQIIFTVIKIIFSVIPIVFKCLGFILKLFKKMFSTIGNEFKKLLRFSLTFKITFVYAVIVSFILLLSSISILFGFHFFLVYSAKEDIKKNSDVIVGSMEEGSEIPENKILEMSKYENITITVFAENKEVIYTSSNSDSNLYFHKGFNSPSIINQEDMEVLVLNNEIYSTSNTIYIQLSKELTYENTLIYVLFGILIVANLIGVIITIIIGFKQSKRMLLPIREMTETVKAITVENLDTRLDVSGSYDELRDLAVTFNGMFDRIQSSYEKQNQFVSDASHELRTPISVIQGYINLLDRWGKGDKEVLDESIVAIKGESEAMKELIEKLLFLARSDKRLLKLQKEDFYIKELINEIVYETKLIDLNHEIIGNAPENIMLSADKKLLKQAIRIFVDNSVKFTPKKGTIKVTSHLQKRELVITVEDTGVGIPKEDIKNIFNRFYRSDKSRTKETGGHGLGLSIAKFIVDEHEGYIKVESQIDVGTKIKIFLPRTKAS